MRTAEEGGGEAIHIDIMDGHYVHNFSFGIDDVPIDANMVVLKYMSVLGSMRYYPEETKEALRLIADGRVNRDILISHTLPLQDAKEGFEIQGDPDASMKVVILND